MVCTWHWLVAPSAFLEVLPPFDVFQGGMELIFVSIAARTVVARVFQVVFSAHQAISPGAGPHNSH